MGWFGPSVRDGVMAIVAAAGNGITFTEIQQHDMWSRYLQRCSKPRHEEVMDALLHLKRRSVVRECSGGKWRPCL